jgi:hypothetical protein
MLREEKDSNDAQITLDSPRSRVIDTDLVRALKHHWPIYCGYCRRLLCDRLRITFKVCADLLLDNHLGR